jgi:FkbM family methyltransferase
VEESVKARARPHARLDDDSWFLPELSVPNPIADPSLEFVRCDAGPGLFFPTDDLVMREYISRRGTWEPDIGSYLIHCLRAGEGVFIDVGANVGYFSALIGARYPTVSVHAFEPHPRLVPLLRLNTWMARARVCVWPLALSGGDRCVSLETSINNLGDTRATRPAERQQMSMVAAAASFDELFPAAEVAVVKIDVQGFEHAVVTGMLGALRRSPGVKVILEFNPSLLSHLGARPQEVLGLYRQMGFEVRRLDGGALVPATDVELTRFALSGGPQGQVNIVLTRVGDE